MGKPPQDYGAAFRAKGKEINPMRTPKRFRDTFACYALCKLADFGFKTVLILIAVRHFFPSLI
jgi:hypothetical protein